MKVSTIMRKPLQLGALTLAGLAVLVAPAEATHWGQEGADAANSSFQVGDQALLPAPFQWRAGPSAPETSPIITAGAGSSAQRVAIGSYTSILGDCGTDIQDTAMYFVTMDAAVETCHDLDDENQSEDTENNAGGSDLDAWGPHHAVSPVEASTHDAPGVTYALYNDDNAATQSSPNNGLSDISMAQFNSATGALIGDRALEGTTIFFGCCSDFDGMNITAGPVMGPDRGDGSRYMFFVMTNNAGTARHLVRVTIPNAANPAAYRTPPSSGGYVISASIPDLNLAAKPAFVNLRQPTTGRRVAMIAVATTDGIKTFRISDISDPGPSVSGLGLTNTPVVPARADGGLNAATPVIYAASVSGEEGTIVRRFMQDVSDTRDPDRERLKSLIPFADDARPASTSTSPVLSGKPSRLIGLEQSVPTTGADLSPQPGRVIVSTSKNIFSLDTEDLSQDDPPQVFSADREVGFANTSPAVSGGLGFILDDKGQQHVFFTSPDDEGKMTVPIDDFLQDEASLDSESAIGQPAVSRGRFVFAADNGLYAYGPETSITSPPANGSVRGNAVTLSASVVDTTLTSVDFYVDGAYVGTDAVNDDRTFSVTWDSLSKLDGPHTVYAIATDGVAEDRSATRRFVVVNFASPTAALTVGPNPANPGQPVVLDASGSAPTPTEVDEIIEEWAFELDGDADFDDEIVRAEDGADGRITHVFEPGTRNVGVRVTDSHGDQAQATVKLRINVPPAANLTVGPNPAAEGQEVTVDAAASTDSDGSVSRYEFDLDGNGTFELDNGANSKVQRVFAPGTTRIVTRVTDNEGAASTAEATLVVNAKPVNQAPTATFKVTPNPAKRDQRVLFDATGAVDPDGVIAKYEWDLDGNGTFETNSQNNPRVQRSYATAKVYNVKLRVTDNAGAVSADFSGTLTITGPAGRKLPRRITARVTPMRDRTLPYDFRTTGRLTRPSGISKKAGCSGRVTVTVKAGKKTISRRTTRLRSNCTYRTSVRFRDRSRIGRGSALRFTARFQGNRVLRARQATTVRVRLR